MMPDEIAAERERFEAWAGPLGYNLTRNNHSQYTIGYTHDGWKSFLRRAEIARVEQAELRAENERLRAAAAELAEIKRAWGMAKSEI